MFGGKTKFYIYSLLLFLFLASLILWRSLKAQEEIFGSCCLYGSVNYRGDKAPDGYKVEAFIGDKKVAETTSDNSRYLFCISQDNPNTEEKDGWFVNAEIKFKINGNDAYPPLKVLNSLPGTMEYNLSVPALNVKLTTWGKIKALFK